MDRERLYREMYDLTHEACISCTNVAAKLPYRCCDSIACENTRKWATLKGVTLKETGHPTLPFMGEHGCVVPIQLRPLCTMHHCTLRTPRFIELRREIEELEADDWRKYLCQL